MRRRSMLAGLSLLPAGLLVSRRAHGQAGPGQGQATGTKMPVVASFTILADIARHVGGDLVSVTSLVPPNGDVHAYEPRPSDLLALRGARVVVENGLGLEGWLGRLVSSSGFSGTRVIASEGVTPRTLRDGGVTETDPHAWQNPRNAEIYANNIAAGFSAADPANAMQYRGGAKGFIASLRLIDAWIAKRMAEIPPEKRQIVTTHDAFGYYAARYGITLHSIEGISTESEPSAASLAALSRAIKAARIRAVFLENVTNPRSIRTLAEDTGAMIGGTLYSDALTPPDGPAPTYTDMLRHNTQTLLRAMKQN